MRGDQEIRAVGITAGASAYAVRVVFVGNGAIPFFGYDISPFGLLVVALVLMALPETIDMLPFGPTRQASDPEEPTGKS